MLTTSIAQYTVVYVIRIIGFELLTLESLQPKAVTKVESTRIYKVTSNKANASTLKAI